MALEFFAGLGIDDLAGFLPVLECVGPTAPVPSFRTMTRPLPITRAQHAPARGYRVQVNVAALAAPIIEAAKETLSCQYLKVDPNIADVRITEEPRRFGWAS